MTYRFNHMMILKTRLLALFLASIACFGASSLAAQNIIPDSAFRACLKETYPQVFDVNDEVILAEAEQILYITCSNRGIESMQGIEFFTNARVIDLSNNALQEVPSLADLDSLSDLRLNNNQITTLPNLSPNIALQVLELFSNKITTFPDLSNNLKIWSIVLDYNLLTAVPDLSANTQLMILGVTANPITTFPDLTFNTKLLVLNISSTLITAYPDVSECRDLAQYYFSGTSQIGSFPDLTNNTKLQILHCSGNDLSFVPDLSHMQQLWWFDCRINYLTQLPDFSQNPNLELLFCSTNNLTQLPDLSQCTQLETLECSTNQLTYLPDLSGNLKLAKLMCNNNLLTSLPDLSATLVGDTVGSELLVDWNQLTFEDLLAPTSRPSYTTLSYIPQKTIETRDADTVRLAPGSSFTFDLGIDSALTSNTYTWFKDGSFYATTTVNKLVFENFSAADEGSYFAAITNAALPDLTLQTDTTTLKLDSGLATIPDPNFRVCLIDTHPEAMTDEGQLILSKADSVEHIDCFLRQIQSIEGVQHFTNVTSLWFSDNQISTVPDITGLSSLREFALGWNNLGSNLPDFSGNPLLSYLDLAFNNLSEFPDLSNNTALTQIWIQNNNIHTVPDLSIHPNLELLMLSNNPIDTMGSLAGNPNLDQLIIQGIALQTFPDLSQNTNLRVIDFSANPQFNIFPDFSANVNLEGIGCNINGMDTIPDLSFLPNLTYFSCYNNNLTSLPNFSGNNLTSLDCAYNNIASLPDLSQHTNLEYLRCTQNALTSLPDLSATKIGSTEYSRFEAEHNKLTFEDLLPITARDTFAILQYSPQGSIRPDTVITLTAGSTFSINLHIDDSVENNTYTWYQDSALVAVTNVNSFSIDSINESHAGVYKCHVTNPGAPLLILSTGQIILNVESQEEPVDQHILEFRSDLYSNINGNPLTQDDVIGVFYHNQYGELQLADTVSWTGETKTITVYGTTSDSVKNGFRAGEQFVFKVWKENNYQVQYSVNAAYIQSFPDSASYFQDGGFSTIIGLVTPRVCQTIELHKGWNLISSYVQADSLEMSTIFKDTATVVVKNAAGIIKYAPSFGINTGTWNIEEGYFIYSATAQSFDVCGTRISPDKQITLQKLSHPLFMPYYGNIEASASLALSGLGTDFNFVQSIEYRDGETLPQAFNYIPAHIVDPPIDQIGIMKPGLAYKVSLSQTIYDFAYPAEVITSGRTRSVYCDSVGMSHHFVVDNSYSLNNAILVIGQSLLDPYLEIGDELAAVDGAGKVLGAIAYNGGSVALTIWESKNLTKDPMYTIKVWNASTNKEATVQVKYKVGKKKFVANSLSIAEEIKIEGKPVKQMHSAPNPFTHELTVSFVSAQDEQVSITLTDITGSNKVVLYNGKVRAGLFNEIFDVRDLPDGYYVCQIVRNGSITNDKVIKVK